MLVLADLCQCFFRSHSKLCPILCRLRTKLCPNFGCSRARLCPITFAPCPFPNLAGTLHYVLKLGNLALHRLVVFYGYSKVVLDGMVIFFMTKCSRIFFTQIYFFILNVVSTHVPSYSYQNHITTHNVLQGRTAVSTCSEIIFLAMKIRKKSKAEKNAKTNRYS